MRECQAIPAIQAGYFPAGISGCCLTFPVMSCSAFSARKLANGQITMLSTATKR